MSYLLLPYDDEIPVDDESFDAAFFAIQCADFSDVPEVWGCEGMPPAADLPVIESVDVQLPILVVGTRSDPATPGHDAVELAAALGDARAITWEGIGHTAFPIGGGCLDETVVAYLVSAVLPANGATCPFVDGATTDTETADAAVRLRRVVGRVVARDRARGRRRVGAAGRVRERRAGPCPAPRDHPRVPRGRLGRRPAGPAGGRGRLLRRQRTETDTPFA